MAEGPVVQVVDTEAGLATQRNSFTKQRDKVGQESGRSLPGDKGGQVQETGRSFPRSKGGYAICGSQEHWKNECPNRELTRTRGLVAGGIAAIQLQAGMGTEVDVVEELVVVEVMGQQ